MQKLATWVIPSYDYFLFEPIFLFLGVLFDLFILNVQNFEIYFDGSYDKGLKLGYFLNFDEISDWSDRWYGYLNACRLQVKVQMSRIKLQKRKKLSVIGFLKTFEESEKVCSSQDLLLLSHEVKDPKCTLPKLNYDVRQGKKFVWIFLFFFSKYGDMRKNKEVVWGNREKKIYFLKKWRVEYCLK